MAAVVHRRYSRRCTTPLSQVVVRALLQGGWSLVHLLSFFLFICSMNTNGHRENNTSGGRRSFGWVAGYDTGHGASRPTSRARHCSAVACVVKKKRIAFLGFFVSGKYIRGTILRPRYRGYPHAPRSRVPFASSSFRSSSSSPSSFGSSSSTASVAGRQLRRYPPPSHRCLCTMGKSTWLGMARSFLPSTTTAGNRNGKTGVDWGVVEEREQRHREPSTTPPAMLFLQPLPFPSPSTLAT